MSWATPIPQLLPALKPAWDDETKRPECFDDMNVVKHPCKGTENIGGPHHDEYGQCIHHWDCRTARMKAWQESDQGDEGSP